MKLKKPTPSSVKQRVKDVNIQNAILSNLTILNVLSRQIKSLEQQVLKQIKLKPEFKKLLQIPGIGNILAMTIMLENKYRYQVLHCAYCFLLFIFLNSATYSHIMNIKIVTNFFHTISARQINPSHSFISWNICFFKKH